MYDSMRSVRLKASWPQKDYFGRERGLFFRYTCGYALYRLHSRSMESPRARHLSLTEQLVCCAAAL